MENSAPVVTVAPSSIPAECICAYTWHPAGGVVRNGPLAACTADHGAVDVAVQVQQHVQLPLHLQD